MRIYLNTSALSRPFDDLRVRRIRLEAEAVTALVAAIEAGQAELLSSEYLLFEVGQHPDPDRADRVRAPLRLAKTVVRLAPDVVARARELERFGLRGLDALHIASAEAGLADLVVTTDDRMLRRARRAGAGLTIRVVSPLDALAALSRRHDHEE